MRKFFIIFITITIISLIACSPQQETEVIEEAEPIDEKDGTTQEIDEIAQEIESDIEVEFIENNDQKLEKGFTSIGEPSDFIINDEMFDSLHFEVIDLEEGMSYEWGIGHIDYFIEADDEKLYYLSAAGGKQEPGLNYEVFTFDENNYAVIEGKVYSPTEEKLDGKGGFGSIETQLVDNILFEKFEYNQVDDGENSSVQVTVEVCDLTPIVTGESEICEATVVVDKTIYFDDDDSGDYRLDFGRMVNTSLGPVFVYTENQEDRSSFQIIALTDDQSIDGAVLGDPHDIVYSSRYITYIDFENGYYFAEDSDALKRLDIESGEPLYDGADDKELFIEDIYSAEIFRADDHSFFVIDDEIIYLISNDLELIDSTSFFANENEADDYEGSTYGYYYFGDNKFAILETYEYQRKDRMRTSFFQYNF